MSSNFTFWNLSASVHRRAGKGVGHAAFRPSGALPIAQQSDSEAEAASGMAPLLPDFVAHADQIAATGEGVHLVHLHALRLRAVRRTSTLFWPSARA